MVVELVGAVIERWIAEVIEAATETPAGEGAIAHVPGRGLPDPRALSARAATQLGSELLAGGDWTRALPYLLSGVRAEQTAFGWCRLGKALREWQQWEYAVRSYDEALLLEPDNSWA